MHKPESQTESETQSSRTSNSPLIITGNKLDFYRQVLNSIEAQDLAVASEKEGLDDEIALLRTKIKEIVANKPENVKLLLEATNTLARLVRIRHTINKGQKKGLAEVLRNVIMDVGVPMGVEFIQKKLK